MLMIFIYLIVLFISPQLWIEPFIGVRIDFYIYTLWVFAAIFIKDKNPLIVTVGDKFFLLMLLWITLSMVANGGFHPRSTDIITNYSKWFLLYKLLSLTVAKPERLIFVANMLVLFSLILAIEGLFHWNNPEKLGWAGQSLDWVDASAKKIGIEGRLRWISIFDGPGVFCVVFNMALPFLLQYLVSPFKFGIKLLALGLLSLVGVAIFLTGSRGGFLTALATIGLFTAIRFNISFLKIVIFSSTVSIVFMLAPSYLTNMNDENKSAKHRVDMWIEGVEMVQQNPVFGIGKGNFLNYTGKLIAHNSAIETMGETGLPGLFFWFGLIYFSLKSLIFYINETQDSRVRSYAIALGLSVVAYIISSLFVTLEYETFYLLLGICGGVGLQLKNPLVFSKSDFGNLFVVTIGWVLAIKIFVIFYA